MHINQRGTQWIVHHLPGIQLEKGSVATPFEFRPYPLELQLCQRYYEVLANDMPGNDIPIGAYGRQPLIYKVTKRTNPTVGLASRTVGALQSFSDSYSAQLYASSNEYFLNIKSGTYASAEL